MLILTIAIVIGYFLFPLGLNATARFLIRRDQLVKADVIIALGGDRRCGREKKAAELYLQGWGQKVIVSGLQYSWGINTGDVAKRYVVSLGVPETEILIIREALNTRAEAQLIKQLMREQGWRTAVIVTSPFHSRRAWYTFEQAAPEMAFYSSPVDARPPEWRPVDWWKRRGDMFITVREFASWANTLAGAWQ